MEKPQPKSLLRTAVALAVLFLLDLGYAGQGVLSLFVACIGLVPLTVGGLWAAVRGAAPVARRRALRAGVYLLLEA